MKNQSSISDQAQYIPIGSPMFPDVVDKSRQTSPEDIDHHLATLILHKDEWVHLDISSRIEILEQIQKDLYSLKESWINSELVAKGIPTGSFGEAEEWTIFATVLRAIRVLIKSLKGIRERGAPIISHKPYQRPNGQVIIPTFPYMSYDRFLFPGVTGEVWMQPGVTMEDSLASQASAYRYKGQRGRVAFILGAGNASVLPVADFLHKLFVELCVVIIKLNPVNAHMGPIMEVGFNSLIERGYLAFVYGGVDVGKYLCNHPHVDELHITGSDKTYEAIVFGSGPEGELHKTQRSPILTKRFTGELGNVSPVIVVPGPWQQSDIDKQANQISTWLVANAGFGCLIPRVIIQHKSWEQRQSLMESIGKSLSSYPTRKAYYPGAMNEHAQCLSLHPEAVMYGTPSPGHLPWTVVPDIDPNRTNDICFKHEIFCGLMAETAIDAPDVSTFITKAVAFANSTIWGTLSATLIIHPNSLRDTKIVSAIEEAIADLRYGTVSLNMLAYYSAYLMTTPWGAFPGHDIFDIQSGIGKTFNSLMLSKPEKSVVRAPFHRLDPLTIKSKRGLQFSRKLADFEAYPIWWKILQLIIIAIQS